MRGGTPEWAADYDSIIAAHLERQPSRVWPGSRFVIPMSEDEWRGFPRIPGWKYEWDIGLGADVQVRPFGPHYRIRVERRAVAAPCETPLVKVKDAPALRRAFAQSFAGYTDYLYCTEQQLLKWCTKSMARLAALLRFLVGCRREEGEYPLSSSTDEQQSTRPKSAQPFGLGRRRRLTTLLAR